MFFTKKNSILGIDIGTANIKIAQINHSGVPTLETYGIVNAVYQLNSSNDPLIAQIAEILKKLISKAQVTTKRCVISFPNSAVFTSVVELPVMSEKDLGSAVEFEAKKYVPLAITEVDLFWSKITENIPGQEKIKILLTAVPKQVTQNYRKLFELVDLEPEIGEIEALALIRSLVGNTVINCVIIDIGAKSTGINIIEKGFLRLNRNINVGGETITDKIAQSLNISNPRAEQFKKDFGISGSTFIPETIKPVLNIIKNEVKQLLTIYQSHNMKIDKIILVGGGSRLPGLIDYFSDLAIQTELGNPLKSIAYNQELAPILSRYGANLSVAIGLALRKE